MDLIFVDKRVKGRNDKIGRLKWLLIHFERSSFRPVNFFFATEAHESLLLCNYLVSLSNLN